MVVPNETELALMCQSTDVDPDREESVCEGARELIQRGANLGVTVRHRDAQVDTTDLFVFPSSARVLTYHVRIVGPLVHFRYVKLTACPFTVVVLVCIL